ncbi:MAG: hypothetical protein RQ722_00765 [Desulfuromonadales bacterium]|nr:hypothetical protein [Desulfuromonadales bacterium]
MTFEGIKVRRDGKVAISQWRGIPLEVGDNPFTVILKDAAGAILSTHNETVRLTTEPVRFELVDDYTYMVADGIHEPRIAIRLFDKAGYAVRAGNAAEYNVNPPFAAATKGSKKADFASQQPRFTVGSEGIALLKLSPTTTAGEAVFTIQLPTGSHEIRHWVKPAPRDWILVGFAQGTIGYNDLSGNQVSLEEADIDEHYYDDGRVKFFAKGAVKGDWLLTMAYDSDKPDLDGDSLHQIIDPDTYYPLYGDSSQQGYEAASASDIYIKLEKDQAYALFGDMSTDLNQTELAQYNRNLNGFKVEQQADNYSFKAFAAETRQTFAKDEIRGDGTSGRYQLSNQNIVINSDQIVIETRGRLHSESIIKLENLSRHTDYEIDYNTGTVYFKQPIPSKDEDFNPIYIVVRYEVEGSTGKNYVYGGRAAVKLIDEKVEVGATYIHEDQGTDKGDLYAVDSTIELTENFKLHVEVARTEKEDAGVDAQGEAYLVELTHESQKTKGKAYFRERDEGFGLGQLNDSEEGMRKYGGLVSHDLNNHMTAGAEIFHEDNLSTDAKRDVVEVTGTYKGDGYQLRAGARHVADQPEDGSKQQSTQALLGADLNTSVKGVRLSTDFEQSLDNNNESEAYPTLLRVGADYKVSERIRLFANQEFTWGDDNDTEATRAGIAVTPWKGGTVETSVEQQINENGQRMFALFGLDQSWRVSKHWALDASLDRSQTIKPATSDSVNDNAPAAHGTEEDFTSVSVGATYSADKWAWSNRIETRQADSEKKYGVSSRIVAEVTEGVAVSAKASVYINEPENEPSSNDGVVTLGMAYRPDDSRWIILERFDFEFENDPDYHGRRLINHLHANWYMNRKIQFSLYSGIKYVYDTIGGQSYDGVTDMHAAETRYNVNSRWDIGAHASWLHSWNGNSFDYAAGVSVGYLVRTNTWVSLGYNFKGFEDPDFSAVQYTAEGPYMRFRMKFDQESVREAAEWLNK